MLSYDKKIIDEFSEDLGIDVSLLIKRYEEGKSREEMAKEFEVTEFRIRNICTSLQLRMKHKHREADLLALKTRLDDDDSELKSEFEKQERELEIIAKENRSLRKSLQKARDTANILRKEVREEANFELMEDFIRQKVAKSFPELVVPTPPFITKVPEWGQAISIADTHLGVRVDEEETGNKYDQFVFKERMIEGVKDFMSSPQLSQSLHIFAIGDLIDATFSKYDQLLNAELDIFEQIDVFVATFVEVLLMLLSRYNKIKIVLNVGNHARREEKAHFSKKFLNFETFLGRELKAVIQYNEKLSERVSIDWHRSTYYMENINGTYVLSMHGDSMKSTADQSIKNAADYGLEIFGKEPEVLIVGHWHRLQVSDIGKYKFVACRSLKSFDPYFVQNSFRINIPGMTCMFFEDGDVKSIYNAKVIKKEIK